MFITIGALLSTTSQVRLTLILKDTQTHGPFFGFGPLTLYRQLEKNRQDTHSETGGPVRLLPNLLGDGDKGIEKVYREEKIFCTGRPGSSQGITKKISGTGTTSPTNQPRKDHTERRKTKRKRERKKVNILVVLAVEEKG